MKKLFGVLLAIVLVFASLGVLTACDSETYEVAMITDSGDITDKSFNQTTWEAVKEYCDENNKTYNYYKPSEDSTAARVAKIEEAIGKGAKVIVTPGYLFAGAIIETCKENPDVRFIVIDCGKGDYLEYGVGTVDGLSYDYNPENPEWDVTKYVSDNVYSIVFQEEEAGYLAGYAAVKDGETDVGFLGGMAVPAVIRFGYGYIQGVQAAAAELATTVNVWYAYGGQFFGSPEIKSVMDTWYANGIDTIFACGGGIYTSVLEAISSSNNANAKIIGVDTDQKASIQVDHPEITVLTSAMKGLAGATKTALGYFYAGTFDNYGGKIETLGLKASSSVEYVGLPTVDSSWDFAKFSLTDYNAAVAAIRDGSITISSDISVDVQAWITAAANLELKAYVGNIIAG